MFQKMLQSHLRHSFKFYRSRPFVFSETKNVFGGRSLGSARLLSVSAVRCKEEIQSSEIVDLINKETSTESKIFTDGGQSLLSSSPVDVSSLLEPSFSSLGLAHGYPSGWAQSLMEVLHVTADLSWVQTIGVTTIFLRLCVFPIMVSAQKAIVNQNKHLVRSEEHDWSWTLVIVIFQPVTQKLQVQAQLASIRGNLEESNFANKALNNYMMANNCHPLKTVLPIAFQACFFTSMFFGIRGMCNAPVESMKTGGLLWFPDLTLADPFCALPLLTASTLTLQIYFNADGMNTANVPDWIRKARIVLFWKLSFISGHFLAGHVHPSPGLHSCDAPIPGGSQPVLVDQQSHLLGPGQGIQVTRGQTEVGYWRDNSLEARRSSHDELLCKLFSTITQLCSVCTLWEMLYTMHTSPL